MLLTRKTLTGLALAAASTATVGLMVEAGAAPAASAQANAVCASLRREVPADVAPASVGHRPPSPHQLERTARAFLPLGREAHRRLVAIAGAADDAEISALVDSYGAALRRVEELSAAGGLGTLYRDVELRRAFATNNSLALRAGAPDCAL